MLRFLALLLLIQSLLAFQYDSLESINQQIAYLEQINYILTQRRHSIYNYSQFLTTHQPLPLQNSKTQKFQQQLKLESSHPSGLRSFLFFLKYSVYNAEVFQNITKISYANGTDVLQINASILFITIVKATIQYQLCYLETSFTVKCGIFDDNISNIQFRETQLQVSSPIELERIKRYHVQKYQSANLHTLLLDQGQIRVYDGAGVQKPIFKSNCQKVVKYLDHNPYPMIVGTDRIAFLQPFKPSQTSLGCPVIEGQILTAEVETPFSNTFYLLTTAEIVVMQYSLKKSDRHCKISHRIPISSPSHNLKMFYPTLLMNNSFVNVSDSLTPPQLQLPIPLCKQNEFDSQYRNNEYYLLHRCCNENNCTSNIYLKSKKITSSSSKHFKYIVFLIIFVILVIKFWNKKQDTNNVAPNREELQDNQKDPMVQYQKRIHKEKMRKAQNM